MLEGALGGGRLGPVDVELLEDAYEDIEYDDEYEDEDEAEHEDHDEDELFGRLRDNVAPIGPHTRLRATSKGEQFLYIAFLLERWLRNCRHGPLKLGPEGADAVSTLVCCWSATVTHALASEPLTLAALDGVVQALDYDTVVEHVEAMTRVGLAEALEGEGETRYALTDWMREGLAPIAAAVQMELHYPEPDISPPDVLDVDAAFELALPLLRLPGGLRGSCRLGVRVPGDPPFLVGATAQVDGGRVASSPLLDERPRTWVTGTPVEWLDALIHPPTFRLEVAGDLILVHGLLVGLHETLFGVSAG